MVPKNDSAAAPSRHEPARLVLGRVHGAFHAGSGAIALSQGGLAHLGAALFEQFVLFPTP